MPAIAPSRFVRPAAGILAACLLLAGCGERADQGGTAQGPQRFTPAADKPFEFSWDLQLPSAVERSWVHAAAPDLAFFQLAGDHAIVCVDVASGATRWTTTALSKPISGRADVAVHRVPADDQGNEAYIDRRLYVIVDDQLQSYDIATGNLIWRWDLKFAPSTGPLAVGFGQGLRVFVGDYDGRVQVLSYDERRGRLFDAWQWNLGSNVLAEGHEREELTAVSDLRGDVHVFKLDRTKAWTYPTGNAAPGGAVTHGRVLFVGNENNTLFALNRLSGEKLGQLNLEGPVRRRPEVFAGESDRVYIWVDSPDPRIGGLLAVRAQYDTIPFTDTTRHPQEVVRFGIDWRIAGIDRIVGSTPKHLLVAAKDSSVVQAVDRSTGAIAWTWDQSEGRLAPVTHLTATADPQDSLRMLISADATGHVAAYRLFRYVPDRSAAPVAKGEAKPAEAKEAAKP